MDKIHDEMRVTKRSGTFEDMQFDKILKRVKTIGEEQNIKLGFSQLCLKVIDQLYDGIPTSKIDELMAEQCASLISDHPDYGRMAAAVSMSNLHKNTSKSFYETIKQLWTFSDIHGKPTPLVSQDLWTVVNKHHEVLENMLDYNRDYLIDYFGLKTLERAYLMRTNKIIVERPQHMWLRVSIGIHGDDISKVKETYDLMSRLFFTHATPTLFNAGTPRPQLSSCFLLSMKNDSIDGIYDTLKQCANISKWAGGIGLHIHQVRGAGSHIRGTNGTSNGIVPMLRNFNETARYVDQGGGKRNGSFAIYMSPYHSDILDFLELKKNHGDENARCRDLFYGLWIQDEFMKRIKNNETWYLMCPDMCPGLADKVGDDFTELYNTYISEGKFTKQMPARDLWFKILDSQMETGTPYLLYADSCNRKSNQQNLGVIKSSNLCTEIIEYSSPDESAVCNLASIALSKFVDNKIFDFDELHKVTKVVARNLDKVIDINYYPTKQTRRSNLLHRPVGIGIQGLADCFALMDLPFDDPISKKLNEDIFETIYHAAIETSCELAQERTAGMMALREAIDNDRLGFDNYDDPCCDKLVVPNEPDSPLPKAYQTLIDRYHPIYYEIDKLKVRRNYNHLGSYSSFEGSPASEGKLQFDLWDEKPTDRYDWDKLKKDVQSHGIRNSLSIAPMPTASTSQILGNNECFEPFTSNIFTRRTLAGDFMIVNKYLISDLIKIDMWNKDIKNNIIANHGSIQQITGLPQHIKDKYKIVWEISMKTLINMASDRGKYVCQSQSMNLWLEDPSYNSLTSMHFYSWEKGCKTGIYYLRRKPKHQPQQFTIDPTKNNTQEEECLMCGS